VPGHQLKFRGAYHAISRLDRAQLDRGVIAWSSGNHAQAVALSARELGSTAVIVMPDDAPAAKLAATAGYGGQVVTYDRYRGDRGRCDISAYIGIRAGLSLLRGPAIQSRPFSCAWRQLPRKASVWWVMSARVWCGGAVALCEAGAGEIVDPGWSDRQGQLVEGSQDP
jgi:hypothetical protein